MGFNATQSNITKFPNPHNVSNLTIFVVSGFQGLMSETSFEAVS